MNKFKLMRLELVCGVDVAIAMALANNLPVICSCSERCCYFLT